MHIPSSQSAATLLQSLTSLAAHRFSSNCPALDSLLTPLEDHTQTLEDVETGLPRGSVLELIGPPGIGKSRTVMAFALAEAFKDEGGKVLAIGEYHLHGLQHENAGLIEKGRRAPKTQKVHSTRVSFMRLLLSLQNTTDVSFSVCASTRSRWKKFMLMRSLA